MASFSQCRAIGGPDQQAVGRRCMSGEDSGPDSPSRDAVSGLDHARLLRLAANGDQLAWNELVDRFSTLLWSICRSYGLPAADAADVFQLTWLRLLEHVDSIQDPG